MARPLASIGERFTAQFIDGLVAFAVGAVFYYTAKALSWPIEIMFLGWLLYLLVCDALPGGQSLGKRFTKSSVVHVETEEPCRYWQSVVRNSPILVLGVIDALFIVGKQRRRLGDFLAKTKVVKAVN
ncbi:RDD family protein [Paracidovorax wautersii]|uniref:RDD family protein n=1 Tax=Paracidovorax wautersii TaxID=1177982 RepID=UPI0015878286|nr:RDD family protein [Paracidovorax wautersii]